MVDRSADPIREKRTHAHGRSGRGHRREHQGVGLDEPGAGGRGRWPDCGPRYWDSPPVKVTCSTAPCAALMTVPTVALVITLSGIRSQANCRPPSGVALGKMRASIA